MPTLTGFYDAVRRLEHRWLERLPWPHVPALPVRLSLATDVPALHLYPATVPAAAFRDVLKGLAGPLSETRPESAHVTGLLVQALDQEFPFAVDTLSAAALRGDARSVWEWAEARDLPGDTVFVLAELAARPFLQAYARLLEGRIALDSWTRHFCPVCGRQPHMGIIDPEGHKRLACPACETQWPVQRHACGLCGSPGHAGIEFFTADEIPGYRVETCPDCGRYLKYVDQRESGVDPELDLFLEDARTVVLDVVAQSRGFHPPTSPPTSLGRERRDVS